MRVSVCVRERARARERECVCVKERVCVSVCVTEREQPRLTIEARNMAIMIWLGILIDAIPEVSSSISRACLSTCEMAY